MEEQEHQLQTVVAILIALATVIGAIIAWRASVAADVAGDADFGGLRAQLNVEETRALNTVTVYQDFSAFTEFAEQRQLGTLMITELETAAEPDRTTLKTRLEEIEQRIAVSQSAFPNRFLNRDGSYNLQRQFGELWADAARQKDLVPEPQFEKAERFRNKSLWLLGAAVPLAFSLILLTLSEAAGERFQVLLIILGALLLVGSTMAAFYIELMVR